MKTQIGEITELPTGIWMTDQQLEVVGTPHTSRSATNPRNHLNNNMNHKNVKKAHGDTMIDHVVQLATKACLSLRC